jgi:subtilisin family serine protease
MGIMVGSDGGINQIGVAPGAKWIGCRNMDSGVGTPASYAECYQWFVAPTDLNDQNPDPTKAPHVINNSWVCPPSEGCTTPDVLLAVVENVRAAGIITVHAAGNSGPGCGTINTPPSIYEGSFTVGNVDSSDVIHSSSSRGPAMFGTTTYTYLKPNVVAPGTYIYSAVLGSGYGIKTGTSMAAPHVAGMIALLLEAEPSLIGQVDMVEALVEQTAVSLTTTDSCGGDTPTTIPNHTYGYGRIDTQALLTHSVNKQFLPVVIAP